MFRSPELTRFLSFTIKPLGALFLTLAAQLPLSAHAADTKLVIGSGGQKGVYYATGTAICRFAQKAETGIACRTQTTKGGKENFPKLRSDRYQIIIARSDWVANAYAGIGWMASAGPDRDLRTLFTVHGEPLTVLVRGHQGGEALSDLSDKALTMDQPARALLDRMARSGAWRPKESSSQQISTKGTDRALCGGRTDAVLRVVGFPSGIVQKTTKRCSAKLVPISGPRIDRLIATSADLSKVTIPGGMYQGNPQATPTVGYRATALTRADIPEDEIYDLVKATFDNLSEFRTLHPAWADLNASEMTSARLSPPCTPAPRAITESGDGCAEPRIEPGATLSRIHLIRAK